MQNLGQQFEPAWTARQAGPLATSISASLLEMLFFANSFNFSSSASRTASNLRFLILMITLRFICVVEL
jgi:hypothetical protein